MTIGESAEIKYCKDCEYYYPNEVYTCHVQAPYSTDRAWGDAENRVLDTLTCRKFYDEVSNISEEQAREYIMPFGKFKNKKFKDIDASYIYWLRKQDWLKMPLKTYVEAYANILYTSVCQTFSDSCDPYDTCPFSGYNEMGYGDLC